jgi:lambda family phage portal protein
MTRDELQKAARPNVLDRAIGWFAPVAGVKRLAARQMMALNGGYSSGDRDRRAFRGWKISGGSADAEIMPSLDKIRSDSRDLVRNAPLATGAINTVVTNVVGSGLRPQARPDRDVLRTMGKLSDRQIGDFERAAEREFRLWANKTDCDASETQTFQGLQDLVLRSVLESGDVFVVRRFVKRAGKRLGTALQVIEADRIDNPDHKADTPELCGGVWRNALGAPVAYNVLDRHPGDITGGVTRTSTRLEARDKSGVRQVLHVFVRLRPQQTRGVPYLAPVIEALKQISRYSEAEIMAAVISSMFTVFVKTEDGTPLAQPAGATEKPDSELKLGNGSILNLASGEDVTFANPGRPSTSFDPFVQAVLRQIGVALEIPFEILIKHFTASYSAAQAAIVEAWKFFRKRRSWLAESFCQEVYEWVVTEAVAAGHIDAPGFLADPFLRAAYLEAEWIGPPRGSIDTLKEANANKVMQDNAWKTAAEITAEMTGGDFARKAEIRAEEQRLMVDGGLASDSQAQEEPAAGSQTEEPDEEESKDE